MSVARALAAGLFAVGLLVSCGNSDESSAAPTTVPIVRQAATTSSAHARTAPASHLSCAGDSYGPFTADGVRYRLLYDRAPVASLTSTEAGSQADPVHDAPVLVWQGAWADGGRGVSWGLGDVRAGDSGYLEFRLQNTGSQTWTNELPNPFRIAATTGVSGVSQDSIFRDVSWWGGSRAAAMLEGSVGPGEVGTFLFKIVIPDATPATYRQHFQILQEGVSWFDPIMWVDITVKPTPITFETFAADPALTGDHANILRLYWAAFDREPDVGGARWWVDAFNTGAWPTLTRIAEHFVVSQEFIATYGQTTNADFVEALYLNTLDRPSDEGGRAFWLDDLKDGVRTRGQVLADFSFSQEFRDAHPLPSDER